MLVLIAVAQLGLADPSKGAVAIGLGQGSDLQTPIPRNPVDSSQIHHHGKLPGQRVSKAIQKCQQRMRTQNLLQRTN